MLEVLTQKLTAVFDKLGRKGKLSEGDIDDALRQVRLALLEADVNFKVVKEFLSRVRERALCSEVLRSLTPAQQIIKIVNEELIAILGGEPGRLASVTDLPAVALLVGLQGSGKTSTAVKLAVQLKHLGQRPLLVAADTRRPAAIEQLKLLGEQHYIPVYSEDAKVASTTICQRALNQAKESGATWVIVDTQGRLHIDEAMMKELADIKSLVQPSEVLLTVDAMIGQDAVRVAQEFHSRIGLTGLILTKMDGDARGGAALSIRFVTGVPIKYMGTGEKMDALEVFHPDRLASRILGMGDMLTFIEQVETAFDQQQTKNLERKMRTGDFDLEDLLSQMRQIHKMGSLGKLVEMVPGFSKVASYLPDDESEKRLKKIEAMILSMTCEERCNPAIIDGRRRSRIARGSGTTSQDVNQLLNQFREMQKLTKSLTRGKLPKKMGTMFDIPLR
ncbi:MAG: signal recognition particle protein [Dehalococcoidia bacterium]|jgi:signal recognition particle subunit SRP54|nr:MAG: signal recognition particle protein [Dehalococcoidia bacterium]